MFAKKVKSYAKVNLSLNVTGAAGGYHLIDSVLASIDIYDTVCVKPRGDRLVNVYMHGLGSENILPERNNAVRAGEAFVSAFSTKGADIEIYKDIPMGAGLGGSSADAAGVLNAMAKLYGIDDKAALGELADALGSDTRYMLDGGFCRMRGRGEKLTFLPADKKTMHFLLICPKSSVASGECYAEYDRAPLLSSATESCIGAFGRGDIKEAGRYLTNALYPAAARLNPDVEKALKEAQSFFPLGAAMTGSGSGVLALFETKELCDWARSRYRGKFRTYTVSTLVPREKKKIFRSPFVLTAEEREISSFKEE